MSALTFGLACCGLALLLALALVGWCACILAGRADDARGLL